jgi:hypothetical protein
MSEENITPSAYWDSQIADWAIFGVEPENGTHGGMPPETLATVQKYFDNCGFWDQIHGPFLDIGSAANPPYIPREKLPFLTAVDLSLKMLKINPAGNGKCQASAEQLPFTQTFAGATSLFVMRYIEKQKEVLAEICRVCVPNSPVVIIDYFDMPHPLSKNKFDPVELTGACLDLGCDFISQQVLSLPIADIRAKGGSLYNISFYDKLMLLAFRTPS